MVLMEEWNAFATRIDGTASAALLYSQFLIGHNTDGYGAHKVIGQSCCEIAADILAWREKKSSALPNAASAAIDAFFTPNRRRIFEASKNDANTAKAAMVMLLGLRTEVGFHMSDRQTKIRTRTELAFTHLQRSIAVDKSIKDRWIEAFREKGETACERLGGLHLLLFGIFAFKLNSERARTDLIFPEQDIAQSSNGSEGLVLTEWKIVSEQTVQDKFEEAVDQMMHYQSGALSGLELYGERFAVLVSRYDIPTSKAPDKINKDGVLYRPVILSLENQPPSRRSKRR